jgi:hypothetical protein
MIIVELFYKQIEENLYNIEEAYLELENGKIISGIPEISEKYTKFIFSVNAENVYSIQVINRSNFESYWVEPLYLNNEKVEHSSYEIVYEEMEERLSYVTEGYDSYG